MAMILDVGQLGDFIKITVAYSNAVVAAVLPHISVFAQKLELPVPPVAVSNIVQCGILPYENPGASIRLKGGWIFSFQNGYVCGFEAPHSYCGLQDPDQTDKFYGEVKMSKFEAIKFARKAIQKLGISLDSVFAEQEPTVLGPFKIPTTNGDKTVPHYDINWCDPRNKFHSARVEVNGEKKRIERITFLNKNLERPPPKIGVTPPPASDNWPQANIEYARRLLPIVLRAVDTFGKRMSLGIPCPLTTNQIARFYLCDNGGWPHTELSLTNGWRFIYRNSLVNGYYAPDIFFDNGQRGILIRNYVGKWNMTEKEAVALARKAIKKFDCASNLIHVDSPPRVLKPYTTGKTIIPRYLISWDYIAKPDDDDLTATACVEIDADSKTVKSAYFDNKIFWGHGPELGVPITLQVETKNVN